MQHRGNWFPYFRWMKVQTQTQTYLIAGMEFSSQYSSGGFYKHCNKRIIVSLKWWRRKILYILFIELEIYELIPIFR